MIVADQLVEDVEVFSVALSSSDLSVVIVTIETNVLILDNSSELKYRRGRVVQSYNTSLAPMNKTGYENI